MEHIIHNFAQGSLFACTEQLFKQLNIELHSSEDLPILPQDFFDKELYRPENKVHQLIQQLYVAGMIGTEEDCLAVIAVELATTATTRTQLSTITRLINRQAEGMPVAVLFRYGNHIALANAERTQYKQTYREGEKIGKVSILKDIDTLKPHRGHLDILETLKTPAKIKTFRDLYAHWQEVFNVSTLNKKFYNELFAWFQWTISEEVGVTYPNDTKTNQDDRVQLEEQVIRLITRVLFVWFIKQKHLVPNNLFEEAELGKILKDFQANSLEKGNYYNAILQNLFFATLNKKVTERAFAKVQGSRDIKTLYRYADMFTITEEEVIALFASIPFLNGGLFECLDKDKGNDGVRYHLDGFSRNDRKSDHNGHYTHRAFIPNAVFFDSQKGLFPLLNRYHFTIEENTPNEVQVALDPELLGNVFENLLGAFNPETKESARKQSGSFYTPKEVVNYMVDESLKTYLHNQLPTFSSESLNMLFEETELPIEWLSQPANCQRVVETLERVKILDPACGSGAFPMGILNRMVYLLEKLDFLERRSLYELKLHLIQNCIYGVDIQTIASQISKLRFFISLIVEQEETNTDAEQNYGVHTLPNLETKFVTANTLISLEKEDNIELFNDERLVTLKEKLFKVRTEHFYAQSAFKKKELRKEDAEICENIKQYLLDIAIKPNEQHIAFWKKSIERLQTEREKYVAECWEEVPMQVDMFAEAKPIKVDVNLAKRKEVDSKIKELQTLIDKEYHKKESDTLKKELETLASWNPYDQNASAPFFDPEWMFGISDGFDIVIGNPPYIKEYENKKAFDGFRQSPYYKGKMDIWYGFACKGIDYLNTNGIICFIAQNNWITSAGASILRNKILENTELNTFVDFVDFEIFDSASIQTMIFICQKVEKPRKEYPTRVSILKNKNITKSELVDFLNFNLTNDYGIKEIFKLKPENYIGKTIHFNQSNIENILEKIEEKGAFKLYDKEVANGIHPHYDFVNNKIQSKYPFLKKGEGIFGLSEEEKNKLNLTNDELSLIKPYYSSEEIFKYYANKRNKFWIIYTDSTFKNSEKIQSYPNIKKHLDRFKDVITSDNKPYGLHRARKEDFFIGEKIITLRKSPNEPKFTYTDFDCYVSATFYVIKTKRVNLKYLTLLLNSKLIAFWLRYKGKMQGSNFQIDKEPLLLIPIIKVDNENFFSTLYDELVALKQANQDINPIINKINILIYKLYGLTYQEVLIIDPNISIDNFQSY